MENTIKEYPMLLTENSIWKVELNNFVEIKIQLNRIETMYVHLFKNQYVYTGANLKLPKYISKIISKHLVIKK